jgi:N-acetylmuramoyl-L-alanine amidase
MMIQDQVIGALCAWRENRSGGTAGMRSVLNVLQNRAEKRGTDIYTEATRKLQFSSMTYLGPEAILFPVDGDPQWMEALSLAAQAAAGTLADITEGATSYYAPAGMPGDQPPNWAATMTQTVTIAGQVFFR